MSIIDEIREIFPVRRKPARNFLREEDDARLWRATQRTVTVLKLERCLKQALVLAAQSHEQLIGEPLDISTDLDAVGYGRLRELLNIQNRFSPRLGGLMCTPKSAPQYSRERQEDFSVWYAYFSRACEKKGVAVTSLKSMRQLRPELPLKMSELPWRWAENAWLELFAKDRELNRAQLRASTATPMSITVMQVPVPTRRS